MTGLPLQDSYSYARSSAAAVAYDSKQYYQQPAAAPAVPQSQPTVAESYYQTGTQQRSLNNNEERLKIAEKVTEKCIAVAKEHKDSSLHKCVHGSGE